MGWGVGGWGGPTKLYTPLRVVKNEIDSITEQYTEDKELISIDILKRYTICNNKNINNFNIKYIHVFDDKNGSNVLFVSMEDHVYGYGSNQWGVCGVGHNRTVKDPKIIPELSYKNIQQFHNGLDFVLAITSDNELYGWGSNQYGQLAKQVMTDNIRKPYIIDINNLIVKEISCGSHHTLMLTTDGMVYGWGENILGQIGCGKELGEKNPILSLI